MKSITLKEIETFLDEKLNYETLKEEEERYGKKKHKIIDDNAIQLFNGSLFDFNVGYIYINKDDIIERLEINSTNLSGDNNSYRDSYVGTDMRKELKERFIGRKVDRVITKKVIG